MAELFVSDEGALITVHLHSKNRLIIRIRQPGCYLSLYHTEAEALFGPAPVTVEGYCNKGWATFTYGNQQTAQTLRNANFASLTWMTRQGTFGQRKSTMRWQFQMANWHSWRKCIKVCVSRHWLSIILWPFKRQCTLTLFQSSWTVTQSHNAQVNMWRCPAHIEFREKDMQIDSEDRKQFRIVWHHVWETPALSIVIISASLLHTSLSDSVKAYWMIMCFQCRNNVEIKFADGTSLHQGGRTGTESHFHIKKRLISKRLTHLYSDETSYKLVLSAKEILEMTTAIWNCLCDTSYFHEALYKEVKTSAAGWGLSNCITRLLQKLTSRLSLQCHSMRLSRHLAHTASAPPSKRGTEISVNCYTITLIFTTAKKKWILYYDKIPPIDEQK